MPSPFSVTVIDSGSGISTTYYYDFIDRLAKYTEKGTGYSHSVEYGYDAENNLSTLKEAINGTLQTTAYSYDADNRLDTITSNGNTVDYTYDDFGRIQQKVIRNGTAVVLTTTYTYYDPSSTTTSTQVKSIQQTADNYSITYTYTYDGNGNILTIFDGANTIRYEYDHMNQLTREDDPIAGTSREFQYRDGGQLLAEFESAYTTGAVSSDVPSVVYETDAEWKDMLTGVNGQSISRDGIGNMLSYNGYSYGWSHGRELMIIIHSSGFTMNTYDANGMRIGRRLTDANAQPVANYGYVYNGSQLSQMTKNGNVLNFFYDGEGRPSYFTYNNATYYYVTNLQGDVVAILDSTGAVMVNYHYDAYGVLLQTGGTMASTLGALNPLTYRGYVYDHETGLYYLQSRYYNPTIRQFISPDAFVSTGQGFMGYNLFAYCGNNPVNRVDPTGQFWKELWDAFTQTILQASGYFAVAAGVSQIDTPVPGPADVISGVLLIGGALVCAGIATYTVITAPALSISIRKAEEKTEAIVIPKEHDSPVIFPVDPNTFNPVGLVKVPRTGTKNGAFISWMDPLTNTEVFRWDENPNKSNGPHYHINDPIYKNADVHFYPLSIVPEPYSTIYFPVG